MGRDGWQISVLLPSDCKSDGTQGIPVLHFQGCLSNSQGATGGWQIRRKKRFQTNPSPRRIPKFIALLESLFAKKLLEFTDNMSIFVHG